MSVSAASQRGRAWITEDATKILLFSFWWQPQRKKKSAWPDKIRLPQFLDSTFFTCFECCGLNNDAAYEKKKNMDFYVLTSFISSIQGCVSHHKVATALRYSAQENKVLLEVRPSPLVCCHKNDKGWGDTPVCLGKPLWDKTWHWVRNFSDCFVVPHPNESILVKKIKNESF